MDRANAIEIIEEIFGEDRYGIGVTMTEDQTEAIGLALQSLKEKGGTGSDDGQDTPVAEWKEYDGEDKGFHYCPGCKQQAFNYEEGGEVVEVLSDFCPWCGLGLTQNALKKMKSRGTEMKNRITVRHGMLDDLEKYLKKSGWKLEPPVGAYEVLRARLKGRPRPLLVHDRTSGGCGYSIDERDMKVYQGWKRNRAKRGLDPDWPTPEEKKEWSQS